MRDVAVVSFSQSDHVAAETERSDVEILHPVVHDAMEAVGLTSQTVGFVVSGSNDYLAGMPFSFVTALDSVGAWPPIEESHVEMDGAWALYEAFVRLQHGDIDTALVYAFGKSSMGDLSRILALQLEPYNVAPLWPGMHHLAALQARQLLETGSVTEEQMAEVAVRSRRAADSNPHATVKGSPDVDALLAEPMVADPLRAHDCAPVADGAAAVVLAAGDTARELVERPAWIRGIDHRIEPAALGVRDLTTSVSAAAASDHAGVGSGPVDLAELYAPYTHQELVLRRAIGLDGETAVNPSGGALAAHPFMVAGLLRIGEAATRLSAGDGERGVAHATSGPCLQQNLVCVLEVDR